MYFEKFCKHCPSETHCCVFNHDKGFTFVSIADAQRIKADTGKEFGEFLDYSPLSREMANGFKGGDPALEGTLRHSQLDDQNRILRLRKKENGKCIFLTDKGKCGIYKSRPSICQIYPFWAIRLIDGSLKVVGHDATPACPIVKSMVTDDVETCLPKNQVSVIKETFEKIEREDMEYKKNISEFAKSFMYTKQ